MYLKLFDEDDFIKQFHQKSNLLLCFGDYTQDDGLLTNMMAGSKTIIRGFLTTPGYNKTHFTSKTRVVLTDCLDFFNTNPSTTADKKITDTVSNYKANPKDWRYYFMKYESFREHNHYGFYHWKDDNYWLLKMGRKQFNGYHWDPFLHEVFLSLQPSDLSLENYGHKLLINSKTDKIWISTLANGFQFADASGTGANKNLNSLITASILNANCVLEILQDTNGNDLEDRIEKLKLSISKII